MKHATAAKERTDGLKEACAVFGVYAPGEDVALSLYLPDPDGYDFSVDMNMSASEITADLLILLDGEEYLNISAGVDGLPAEGETGA